MEQIRLQKYLAMCGVASRRAAEKMITEGKVSVNGAIVTELGTKVTQRDRVSVEGEPVKPETRMYYVLLNKPEGVLSSAKDDRGRTCVVDLIKGVEARLFPVGRLDYDTSGLI